VTETVDARKNPLSESETRIFLAGFKEVVALKGKKVVRIQQSKGSLDLDEVLTVGLGPTGNLRAPAIRKGATLIIGFNEDEYRAQLL